MTQRAVVSRPAYSLLVRTIQLAEDTWLVVDEQVVGRFLVVRRPLVHHSTRQTHIVAEVQTWHIDRTRRKRVAVFAGVHTAFEWCEIELERPEMVSTLLDRDGRVISGEVQRERWAAGLDPLTGEPRLHVRVPPAQFDPSMLGSTPPPLGRPPALGSVDEDDGPL